MTKATIAVKHVPNPVVNTVAALFLAFALSGLAQAQSLASLLPAETFLALGTENLAAQQDKLQPFIAEFERLELGAALARALGTAEAEAAEEAEDALEGLSERLGDLDVFDLLGSEAWVAVSATAFNPLPALTLLTRLSGDAVAVAQAEIAEAAGKPDVQTLQEGDATFYVRTQTGEDAGLSVIAYALRDDVLALSTNPDVLRGVLRQHAGSPDPDFTAGAGYGSSLGALPSGVFYGYLDYPQVARSLQPFASNLGFDQLVTRLAQAFTTAGVTAGVLSVTDDGFDVRSVQRPDAAGGDAELYALLTAGAPADRSGAALVPAGALSFQVGSADLLGWWNYLNGITAATPELGADLDTLLLSFLGLDLRQQFFAWTGGQVVTVTTGVGEVAAPGVPSENLLGDTVFAIRTTDEAAAQAGLASLIGQLSSQVAAFTDPMGGAGGAQSQTEELHGVTVTRYRLADGLTLSTAVTGGYAFIATSGSALDSVLATVSGAAPATDVGAALSGIPESATNVAVVDDRATLTATAQQLVAQLQLVAGMGGGATLDFDAVEDAGERLEAFVMFVAERLGSSVGYSEVADGEIRGFSRTEVRW
jgi:hypothetical protein